MAKKTIKKTAKPTAKKRNPTDATMRNIRAAKARITLLENDLQMVQDQLANVIDDLIELTSRVTVLYDDRFPSVGKDA